ncbi:MAG TPA: hypothetical protein VN782_09120 [Usitatibacter sp.]|nr:hypothetical protein [Usitatibacter sp.]
MKTRRLATVVVSSALLALGFAASAADEAAPKVDMKTILENDKVLVIENHFKPGAENESVPLGPRVVRALTSGTLERHYPDGKKERIEFKAGEVRFNPAARADTKQYTTKNIGDNELVLYLVILK